MVIGETWYGICIQGEKASQLSKKLYLPGLHEGMMYKLDLGNP